MSPALELFELDNAAHEEPDFCFLWSQDPEGMELGTWKLMKGLPVSDEYPKDARFTMSNRTPGMELTSLIGNTSHYLVVEQRLKESIERSYRDLSRLQCFPVAIYNHKKRLASADYFIINPLGGEDCLDRERSEIVWHTDGRVVAVRKIVISAAKVKDAPGLFRLKEDPLRLIIRDTLIDEWIDMEPPVTNIKIEPVGVVE